jgi:hypothetical protein
MNVKALTMSDVHLTAKKYTLERSSFLVAVIGGIVGGICGICIHRFVGSFVAMTCPAGTGAGVALALLLWRGSCYWEL